MNWYSLPLIVVYNDSRYIMLKVFWLIICESVQKTCVWKCIAAWVWFLRIQKIFMKEGIRSGFEIEYLYVHNTLLKHHEVLKMYHEQMPSLSEKM